LIRLTSLSFNALRSVFASQVYSIASGDYQVADLVLITAKSGDFAEPPSLFSKKFRTMNGLRCKRRCC